MSKPMRNGVQALIDTLNEYEERGQWLWLVGLAQEVAPVLAGSLDRLGPLSRQVIEHYLLEQAVAVQP